MAARKKAEPKPEAVEKVDTEPKVQAPESEEVETPVVEPEIDDNSTPAESEPTARREDGGLAALQAKFDDASQQGYFGPDKEFQ